VPWGKHNPAYARLRFSIKYGAAKNQTAFLPVVTVRHPYSWARAICEHPYGMEWIHSFETCDNSLELHRPARAAFGAAKHTHYDSILHAWRDWNLLYFQENDFPLLIVRLEDLTFRPEPVVRQICECIGGKMVEDFIYNLESANKGRGHGTHRSDLLGAWIKYGEPIRHHSEKYSRRDWQIIRKVLQDDGGMMDALHYPR
jgi:hypothetical protein